MITAGRNAPSEGCQIFLNIGGAVFSLICLYFSATCTAWNQNYAFHLNHNGFLYQCVDLISIFQCKMLLLFLKRAKFKPKSFSYYS